MKKIISLGHSLTAIKTIEEIKSREEVEVTVISQENIYPYNRGLVVSLPAKKITQNKVLYRPVDDYEKQGIRFIFDKKPTRINFKRGRVTLDDKEHLDYDFLILTEFFLPPFHHLKGANKTGLFNVRLLSDMTAFVKFMPLAETIVVESDHLAGLKTALALCEANKETLLVTSGKTLLNGSLAEADALILQAKAEEAGLRIFFQNRIAEILGDADAKAIRLQNGKVYGCQAVLSDADLPDLRLFKETELQFGQRVAVNNYYQTNFENVFALDGVCDNIKIKDWDISSQYLQASGDMAKTVSSKISGQDNALAALELNWEINIKGMVFEIASHQGAESQVLGLKVPVDSPQQNSCINV